MNTCTAPIPAMPVRLDPDGDPDFQDRWACEWLTFATTGGITAPAPQSCEGTDWPPLTSWQRYAAERREGVRVPPSVSVWRPQDVRRQALAERRPAFVSAPAVVWGPGPGMIAATHDLPSGWRWNTPREMDQWDGVVIGCTNGPTEVWLDTEGDVNTYGPPCAPATVYLAVLKRGTNLVPEQDGENP